MLLPILENSTPTGSTGHTTAHYFLLTSHALRYRKRQRPAADLGRVRRSRRRLGGETRLCRPRRTSPTREPEAPEIQHGPPGHGDQPGRRLGRGHRASHGTLLLSLRVTARSQAPAGEADPGGTPGSGNWVTTGCPPVAPAPRGSVGEIPRVAVCPSRWAAAFLTSTTSLAGGKREKPAAERALRAVKTWALHSLPALKAPERRAPTTKAKSGSYRSRAGSGLLCWAGGRAGSSPSTLTAARRSSPRPRPFSHSPPTPQTQALLSVSQPFTKRVSQPSSRRARAFSSVVPGPGTQEHDCKPQEGQRGAGSSPPKPEAFQNVAASFLPRSPIRKAVT